MYPGAANPFPDAGTWRRTSEGLSAAARQPAVLSWCVPSISRPAGGNVYPNFRINIIILTLILS